MKDKNAIKITPVAEFFAAKSGDDERFYPVNQENREAAMEFDDSGDPPKKRGHAVYDINVSSAYAVALYGSLEEAEAHEGTETPEVPETALATDPETAETPSTDTEPRATPFKKRKRGKPKTFR